MCYVFAHVFVEISSGKGFTVKFLFLIRVQCTRLRLGTLVSGSLRNEPLHWMLKVQNKVPVQTKSKKGKIFLVPK
jgi:hypothetical protein